MEEILHISKDDIMDLLNNSIFGQMLKKCRKKIELDLENKILEKIQNLKPKLIYLEQFEFDIQKNLQLNLEYKSELDYAKLKKEKKNNDYKYFNTGVFSKANFEFEKTSLNNNDQIRFLLVLKNKKICVAGENEYIRIYNNYNFDNYYLIKAGSDKRDKCAFISEIDDDKIMCSTIFSKEFLIYKIDENEEQCIYKKNYLNEKQNICKGIQLINNEILLISYNNKISQFYLNKISKIDFKMNESFHNELKFKNVFDFKNEEEVIILYSAISKSDYYLGFYNHIKKKFINSVKLDGFKIIRIINLSEYNLNLYSCCQLYKYYIIIGDNKGFIHEFFYLDNNIILVQKIKNEDIINNLIMKDNYMIATSFSNNPILNPSLVKLYKADFDQILKNQPEFDINLFNK